LGKKEIHFTLSSEDYYEFIKMLETVMNFDPWYIEHDIICRKILFLLGNKDIEKYVKSNIEFWKKHPDVYKSSIKGWEELLKINNRSLL